MEIQSIIHKKTVKVSIIFFAIFFAVYLGILLFFSNHFYYGSVINGINVSGKTVDQVDKEISMKSQTYTLEFKERNGVKEQIKGTDISLKYKTKSKIQVLKDSQNSFAWIFAIFSTKDYEMDGIVTYDEKLLKEHFDKLSCFDSKKIIQPKNASFKYADTGYLIVNEVIGNKINSKLLYTKVVSAILKGETSIDLEKENYYINPKYTSKSKEVLATKILLDKYTASKITYTFTGGKEVLDGSTIHNWIDVNKNLEIIFDQNKMQNYIEELDNNYNTFGKQRDFVTSLGTTVKVSGGDYGWLVNPTVEVNDLIVAIKNGQVITKQPKYSQTAASHNVNDIGNTYVEINIARQHLWFYKNGSLVVQGDVVTGNVSINDGTPTGVYRLKYKEKDATLIGEGYSVPVAEFMPFNGGIGIHPATWRNKFGGNIYLTNGSHGCINSPPSLAKTIYDNIDVNTAIVCY
ncbi:L,D-transpeptidase family protein [Clostridium akagii]|uniref:L,D-transpeptidase family protein n=1 Tax=Clostridium akagii TaxID=91623 RepID=UPI00047D2E10|nr:L,D-transpeptidase family protein [Clostridium akagii]